MGRWRQLPIRWKVLLVVLLPIILVSVLLNATVLGGNPLQGSISRSAESNLLTRGSQLANGISERLTIVQVALRGSTQSNAVTAYAEAHLSGDASRVEAARPALDDYLRNAVSLGEVALVELRVVNSKGDPASVIRRDASGTPQVLANLRPGADAANALFTEALAAPLGFGLARTSLQTDFASDSKQQEATLELALPIKVREQAAGVIIGRLSVRELLTPLLTFEGNDPFQVRFSVLTTEGQLLITTDPQAATAEGRITWWGSPNLSTLPLSLPEVAEVLRSQQLNTFSQQVFRAYPLAVTEGTISNLDWALIASKPVIDSIAADAINERNRQAVFAVFGLLALAGLIFFVGQQLTRPLVEVSNFAQRVAAGDFNARMNVESTDEVGQVATTLNAMSARVSDLVRTLEQDVNVRKRNLEIAAEIGRDAVQLRDINDLLQRTVNAIRDRFAFYHAQVFLVDEANEYAVLVTSTGEIGQQMLARRHKLAVGSDSIVGQVTAQGRTFVTLDTARSEVPHRFNPLLPRTRSEMALPLRSGDSVIGALDIQSVEPSAFNDEDVRIFQVLADQLASAITNARLFADSQERLDQINELNRQLTARSWDEFVTTQSAKELAFEYDLMNVTPTEALLSSKADGNGSESVTEITVRGEVVGEVAIPHLSNAPLTQEDQLVIRAVADRVALAIENARLVERTQGALSEVERLYYATRALSGAATMDDVYRILKDQVTAQAFVDSVVILAARPVQSPDAPAFETAYLWSRDEKAALGMFEPRRKFASDLIPQQWRKPEQAANQASLIANLETDLVEYDVLRQTYRTFGVRSVLVTALRTGERWFGLLLVQSRRPRVFLEAFRKFVTTLADQVATALENRVLFQAAEDERQTLESVLNSLPTGVIVVDEDATTSISNEQARQLLGLDENEPFERFRTATGSQYLEDDFPPNFALRTGEPVVAEDMTVVNADGFRTDLLVNAVPVFNNEGRVISAVAVFQDVTELRELESVLQESLRETTTLYEASRAIANEADLTGVMDVLLTQTQNAIHASALYLIFNNSQNEITQVYRGAVKEDQNEVVVLDGIGVPVPRWALTDEQVVEIDVNANPEAANAPELKAEGILAFYVFPLLARARTVGWLVAAFDTPQDLSSEDRRFINTIADQTAVAAEGIRLSQETQQALSETTLLYEASYAINRADTILGAVEIMRDQVQYFGPTGATASAPIGSFTGMSATPRRRER
jgi:PAS domain S-box-containing protein